MEKKILTDTHGSTPSQGTHPKKLTGPKMQDDGNNMTVDKKYALPTYSRHNPLLLGRYYLKAFNDFISIMNISYVPILCSRNL